MLYFYNVAGDLGRIKKKTKQKYFNTLVCNKPQFFYFFLLFAGEKKWMLNFTKLDPYWGKSARKSPSEKTVYIN